MITDPVAAFAETIADLQREIEALQQKASRSAFTTWANVTLASANWSGTIQWRRSAGWVELRGTATRTTSSFAAGGDFIELDTNGIPEPSANYRPQGFAEVAAATPDLVALGWFIDVSTHNLRTTTATHNLAIGDQIHTGGMWWPIG